MPHRKVLRQLAEKHREEIQKQKAEEEEYPNDFEEETEQKDNAANFNLFQVLEEKRKKNLVELVRLCENQLNFTSNESKHPGIEGKYIKLFTFLQYIWKKLRRILQRMHRVRQSVPSR